MPASADDGDDEQLKEALAVLISSTRSKQPSIAYSRDCALA